MNVANCRDNYNANLRWVNARLLDCFSSRVRGQIEREDTWRRATTSDHAGALLDPLVAGVDRLNELVIVYDKITACGTVAVDSGELAPAGALVGLAKRGLRGIPAVAVKTPDDLSAAFDLMEATA